MTRKAHHFLPVLGLDWCTLRLPPIFPPPLPLPQPSTTNAIAAAKMRTMTAVRQHDDNSTIATTTKLNKTVPTPLTIEVVVDCSLEYWDLLGVCKPAKRAVV
jgi:hypothetical protein